MDMGEEAEADLVKQLDDEKAAHAKSLEEVGAITSAVAELESEKDSLKAQLAETTINQEATADADVAVAGARVAALETQMSALVEEHSQALLQDTMDMGTETKAELVKQLDDEKAAHAKSCDDITGIAAELEARATKAKSDANAVKAQLAEMTGKQEVSADADAAAASAHSLLPELESQLSSQEEEHSQALQDTMDMGEEAEADLVKQLDDEKAAHAKSLEEVGAITSAVAELESEKEALKAQLAESAGKQEATADADVAAASARVTELDSKLKSRERALAGTAGHDGYGCSDRG